MNERRIHVENCLQDDQSLYEWLLMPFSLCNAPVAFMCLINGALHPFTNSFVIVYLDYILAYSVTWEEHTSHRKKVLETLKIASTIRKP